MADSYSVSLSVAGYPQCKKCGEADLVPTFRGPVVQWVCTNPKCGHIVKAP
jgi:hypothetical protein